VTWPKMFAAFSFRNGGLQQRPLATRSSKEYPVADRNSETEREKEISLLNFGQRE
jgi:hypothetical protein